MMARIKGLVVFGFFAVLVHNLHAQLMQQQGVLQQQQGVLQQQQQGGMMGSQMGGAQMGGAQMGGAQMGGGGTGGGAGAIRCAPSTYNYDFPRVIQSGLLAATATRTNTITITAAGTVTLRLKNIGIPATAAPTITLGNTPVAGAPASWAAWGTTGCPVQGGTYRVVITANNPGAGVMDPYHVVAGIDDGSGGCVECYWYGRIGQGSGTTNFGTDPGTAGNMITTCTVSSGGGGTDSGPIAGPGAGNSPPNNKDRFTVLLNTGRRSIEVGQIQGNKFTSFGGIGTYNARNSLRYGDKLRLFYTPMIPASMASGSSIPASTASESSCCLSGLNRSIRDQRNRREVVIRTRVSRESSRGSGRVSRRR